MLMEDRTNDIAQQIEYSMCDYEHVVYAYSNNGRVVLQMDNDDSYIINVERY